ncbi:MAG: sulfatase-like hydrolase/transferase [Deltaproteobacteria bacterium]|nr:sulfatase-like hydrolase/transferase [Deltaproteobacteria bacterium]
MNNEPGKWESIKYKINQVYVPGILVVLTLFFFGPAVIYSGNITEFDVSLVTVLMYYSIPAGILLLLLLGISMLLSKRLVHIYAPLLLSLGVLLWIQGNILVWHYGVLGKGDIDWTRNVWRGWVDGSLWAVVLIVFCLFYKHIYKKVKFFSIVLLLMQFAYLGFLSLHTQDIWGKKDPKLTVASDEMFEFSSKQNIIHIILDEFQSTVFEGIIAQDTDHYTKVMDGFTFFDEASGSFPTTILSIPAILTGRAYNDDRVLMKDFIAESYKGKSITNLMYDQGYEVDFAVPAGGWYRGGKYTNYLYLSASYGGTAFQQGLYNSSLMIKLVCFRYAPHFVKKYIDRLKVWHPLGDADIKDIGDQGVRHLAHTAFLQDLIDGMSIRRDNPVYKFIHMTTTHYPMLLNEKCECVGKIIPTRWPNIKVQAKCVLDHAVVFLNKLKSLGIYDSALIIIHADHGYWKVSNSAKELNRKRQASQMSNDFIIDEKFSKVICSAAPLLAIKPPYSKGPMKKSPTQAALTDIPDTIRSIMGINEDFGGRDIFAIMPDEQRERRFVYYSHLDLDSGGTNRRASEYFGRMDKFLIKGSIFDQSSWHPVSAPVNAAVYEAKTIDIGTADATPFLGNGWSDNERDNKENRTYCWALEDSASISLRLPKDKDIILTANVKTFIKNQEVSVIINGSQAGLWQLSSRGGWENHSVLIKADLQRPDISVIEFVFSKWENAPNDPRKLAVLFESIKLEDG